MKNWRRFNVLFVAVPIAFLLVSSMAHAYIVNIDATRYGFHYPGHDNVSVPAPNLGDTVEPLYWSPATGLNQLALAAGIYKVTNAAGLSGATNGFTGWNYNRSQGTAWVWNFVIADDTTKKVVLFGSAGGQQVSQEFIAGQPDVRKFSAIFTLPTPATLDFFIQDWYLPDNLGGVALNIQPVPLPASLLLFAPGLVGMAAIRRRIKIVLDR